MNAMDARAARIERDGRAQRWVSILVGLLVVFVVGWMTLESMNPHPIRKDAEAGLSSTSSSSSSVLATSSATSDASTVNTAALPTALADDLDSGLFMPALSLGDAATLGSGAPRQVKLGLVLVVYQGAEGAPSNARSKADALVIATRLLEEAKTDFHHAVTSGDSGSLDNIGAIPRGVLDPKTEAAVFALSKGDVSEVLDTTRGYWIAKRIE